jgi:transaldolase
VTSLLTQLKSYTTVVADTGELPLIKMFSPEDATTNPSLILKAVSNPEYNSLLEQAISQAKGISDVKIVQLEETVDRLIVLIGTEILKYIPGRISTEVDARLSFDTKATIDKARKLIGLYEHYGFTRDRVLIKMAATWEGIRAAEQLEKEGINCNLTLLFSFAQARACAEAGVYLISPFVGRIMDWYKAKTGESYAAENDPGVISVKNIYQYYKQHGYTTIVMGASFRNIGEILALSGCDRLTISPALLEDLDSMSGKLERVLVDAGKTAPLPIPLTEAEFRWEHNQDAMATEKLAEGIRNFAIDQNKLEDILLSKFN